MAKAKNKRADGIPDYRLIAKGYLGDLVTWKDGYEVFDECRDLLMLLEEIGVDSVDWSTLLDGLPRFSGLDGMEFPPLYLEDDFAEIPGFETIVTEPKQVALYGSFMNVRIRMDHSQKEAIFRDFRELCKRLENYLSLFPFTRPQQDESLTAEIARQPLTNPRLPFLPSYTTIEDDEAEILSKHCGYLSLGGLTSLSDAAAESLSKHTGGFTLGLKNLSEAVAKILSNHRGLLNLSRLTSLSDAAAESLSKHGGDLLLNGLTSLTDAAAESLSKHCGGDLHLKGLTSLSDTAAESLSKHGGYLELGGLMSPIERRSRESQSQTPG